MNTGSSTSTDRSREIWLIRHGETAWSLSGQHTGRTDVPLTARGIEQAKALAPYLATRHFDSILTSPMSRARQTTELAGLGNGAHVDQDLREWDYGIYEGRTTTDIQREAPNWSVWTSNVPEGESPNQIEARARALTQRLLNGHGRTALFSHAHFLRAFASYWVTGTVGLGEHLSLDTAAIGILGFDRGTRVIQMWNLKQADPEVKE